MDHTNLLCDEQWLSTPTTHHHHHDMIDISDECTDTKQEEFEADFLVFFEKEELYLPNKGLFKYLQSRNLVFYRFRAIQWLIKSCTRLNLSMVALFNAANYLDRFISLAHCHEWKNWMVELLSVACLSVASKFSETFFPSLHEIQMEGLDHTFEPIAIEQMELILLNTLDWRLNSTTAYSCVELLMTIKIDDLFKSSHHKEELVDRVNKLLLQTILDYKMVECKPSIVAISAMWCSIEELNPSRPQAYLTHIAKLFNHIHKDEITKCRNMIFETKLEDPVYGCREKSDKCPSSPVTVLLKGEIDGNADLSIFTVQESDSNIKSNKKRKRMEDGQ
ncbi:CYCLIN D7 1 [Euphorbia peplus]|nr:CYCLIN D7 1 [Euphorbia peplus]